MSDTEFGRGQRHLKRLNFVFLRALRLVFFTTRDRFIGVKTVARNGRESNGQFAAGILSLNLLQTLGVVSP